MQKPEEQHLLEIRQIFQNIKLTSCFVYKNMSTIIAVELFTS